MIRQAFYNALANGLVVIMSITLIALYFVFEMFLRPLLWAILIGSFIHPIKSTVVNVVDGWIYEQVAVKDSTLTGGIVYLTFRFPLEIWNHATSRRHRIAAFALTAVCSTKTLSMDMLIDAATSSITLVVHVSRFSSI